MVNVEQLNDGKSVGSSTHSGFPHTTNSSQNENEKCPYLKMKTNKSLQKSEYCEEADKCELNENFININIKNKNNDYCQIEGSFNNKENQNLINIESCNSNIINSNQNIASKCNGKEFNLPISNKKIHLNNKIIDPNTGQSQSSNNKRLSCTLECDNTFSFNQKNCPNCEIQNKVNAESDLYFSDNTKQNNNHARPNEGII